METAQNSISAGYDKALSSISDANITTLIAAIVLFAFGTGPIKGICDYVILWASLHLCSHQSLGHEPL